MRKLLLIIGLLPPVLSYAQGVRFDIPPILTSAGKPVPLPIISLCPGTATISGAACSPATGQSTTDITNNTLCPIGSPVTLTGLNTCQATGDTLGNAGFWLKPGAYIYCITGTGITGACYNLTVPIGTTSGGNISTPGNLSVTGTATITGALTAGAVNGAVVVATFTDAGIQTAVTAAPDGGEVYMPQGTYVMTGTGACQVTITKRITLHGAGWTTLLQVGASVPATTDIICFKPPSSSAVQGGHLYDFAIQAASGTPGRHGIAFDGTNGPYSNLEIDHIQILPLGSTAIATINAGSIATGTPFTTSIHDNYLANGLDFTNGGDNIGVESNILTGTGAVLVGLTPTGHSGVDGGAHAFRFVHNNVTLSGMIQITNAWGAVIENNNLEQTVTSTEPNNCVVDIIGNSSPGPPQGIVIAHNYLGANSSLVGCSVRVDKAKGTQIVRNYCVNGSASPGGCLTLTANADRTYFGYNRQAPDNTISTFLSDSGTNTAGDFTNQTTGVTSHYGTQGYSTAAGVTGAAITASHIEINPTNGLFCATSGDPSSTGCDTVFWRAGANSWGIGNAYGDTSGNIVYQLSDLVEAVAPSGIGTRDLIYGDSTAHRAKMNNNNTGAVTVGTTPLYNAAGTEQLGTPHLVADTCTLGTNCGITLAGSAAYTSATSYTCTCHDQTTPTNACNVNQTGGGALTITGTGTDLIRYQCSGN